jgi:hypothetical protein
LMCSTAVEHPDFARKSVTCSRREMPKPGIAIHVHQIAPMSFFGT